MKNVPPGGTGGTGGPPVNRRTLLGLGGALAAAALTGCSALRLEPDVPSVPLLTDPNAREAPMLAARVAAGTLPPLEQRLPVNPQMVQPIDRAGVYGGTWRTGMNGSANISQAYKCTATDALMTWNLDFTEPVPNIAESVEVSPDGRVFTFRLREGIRWSDGALFTSDDVVFAYNDVMLHPDLGNNNYPEFVVDGESGVIERIDDLTFAFRFAGPNGLFLGQLASAQGWILTEYPKHYLAPFHVDHNPGVQAEAVAAGFAGWSDYFYSKCGRGYWDLPRWQTTELPTLTSWIITEPFGAGARMVAERNPYYYKVDPDGRQLPYLDYVVLEVVGDPEIMTVQATNGEISFPQVDILTLDNKPVFAANRERGGYRFVDSLTSDMNQLSLELNVNGPDEVLRTVFRERDFRVALSLAINRREIIDAVYQRQGEPWQLAPRRESPFFDEEMATQFTDFDPDRANALLDGIGLDRRDGSGIRLLPDGRPLAFDMAVTELPSTISALTFVSGYWRAVGVDMRVQRQDRSLFNQRRVANELTAAVWSAAGGLLDGLYDPRLWVPLNNNCLWAPLWAQWYSSFGADGEQPPPNVAEQMRLYRSINDTAVQEQQFDIFRQVLSLAKQDFYTIGICLPVGTYTVVPENFRNIPENYVASWIYPTPGPMRPEQFYLEAV